MQSTTADILNSKFQIIDCLKKDDHSAVYTAYDDKKKKVIIKVLNTSNLSDPSILERFKREAKILTGLEHKNINNVLDYWSEDENFFISFEYFESKNLRIYLKNNKPTEDQKRSLIKQLFAGINYAHSKGIIHRDLKPENIIVSDKLELKIIDFGLALGMNDSLVTAQYSLVGTPSYMSPEQIQGDRPSFKSDLFSAGIVTYEIYTGVNPFLGKDINDTLNKILSYDENSHLELLRELPEDINQIVSGLLKKEPSKRINSAADVLSTLKETHVKEHRVNKKIIIPAAALLLFILSAAMYYFTRPVNNYNQNTLSGTQQIQGFPADTKMLTVDNNKTPNKESKKEETPLNKETLTPEKEIKTPAQISQTPVIKKKGELAVECIPWAYIYVDSVRTDVTPLKNNIVLDEGTHQIRLVHPNYPVFSRNVTIRSSQETLIKVNLDTLFGYLDCKISPWGEVYVNNSLKGETPLQSSIKLLPGEYKILIKNNNFAPAEYLVRIAQNQTYVLRHNFRQVN